MKIHFDGNGNLVIRAEDVTEKVALNFWVEKQISRGFITEELFTSIPPVMIVFQGPISATGQVIPAGGGG